MAHRSIARPDEIAYYLAHAPTGTTVDQPVKVADSRWTIESCFQSVKNECGLGEYEVRRYVGWYRHVTLAMLAHGFLAATTTQAGRERGAAETDLSSARSDWQKSDGSWQLAAPAQNTTALIAPIRHSDGPAGAVGTRPPPCTATTNAAPPVTNSRHMTARQLAALRNKLLTSRNSELQLER
ncbi:hypothetical protein AB0G83_10435 [Streptomyces klenkii]